MNGLALSNWLVCTRNWRISTALIRFRRLFLPSILPTHFSQAIEDGGTLRDLPGGKPVDIQSMFTAGATS